MITPHDRSPLPWRADGGTIYDATGSYVLDCWWEDAARIVASVNGIARLEADNARLRGALEEIEDGATGNAGHCPDCDDIAMVAHRALEEARDGE